MNRPMYGTAKTQAIVVGAGIGGLSAALKLTTLGIRPIVVERSGSVGGKASRITFSPGTDEEISVDQGPTVLTMLHVFEQLFREADANLHERVTCSPAHVLARHFWPDGSQLDLFSDLNQSAEAIRSFAGSQEMNGFIKYHQYAEAIYENVKDVFIFAPKPSPIQMVKRLGLSIVPKMMKADFRRRMWSALSSHFKDERLRQLFGRYATYAGNNPFLTPATFNLIAHVEQRGVWRIQGGIQALAHALADLIIERGGEVRTETYVEELIIEKRQINGVRLHGGERLLSDIVIFNGDAQALSAGALGEQARRAVRPFTPQQRSLSALTLCAAVDATEAPLSHHNVFFSEDYHKEFQELESGQLPSDPTIYLCAQDRHDEPSLDPEQSPLFEPALTLVNAPALSDVQPLSVDELDRCKRLTLDRLRAHKIRPDIHRSHWTAPTQWAQRFPHSGGAIYGMAAKRWDSTLKRAGCKTAIRGLFLAGGSAHPGAGVPMTALSGQIAANLASQESRLTVPSLPMGITGGISME